MLNEPPCDSGRLPEGEDANAAECEASQSGPTGHRPTLPTLRPITLMPVKLNPELWNLQDTGETE